MTILRILILSIFLIIGLKLEAQTEKADSKTIKNLELMLAELANEFLEDSLMKSISIGIYYKGEELYQHSGELDEGIKNKPSNKTIYDIGSVTKTFVGTLMAKAELEGKLSIEDDIRDYLDGDYPNLQYDNKPLKIKHLITHTSGIPQWLPASIQAEFVNFDSDLPNRISAIQSSYTKEHFFEDLKKIQIDMLPGTRYLYSNAGSELASFILEKAYGIPFEKLLKEELFIKANMPSTLIKLSESQKELYANGYGDFNNLTPPNNANLWGGGGHGKSTIKDLVSYMKYHMSQEEEVQKSHQILYDKEIIHGDPRNKIAYMWTMSTDGDFGKYFRHHGGTFGIQNWMMLYPEEQIGISVITNQSGMRTSGKLLHVVNEILNEFAKLKYATNKSETEQITETLRDYIEGSTKAQIERLNKAFHPDLNLYYIWGREFMVWSGKEYIEDTRQGGPTGENGEILSIDYENDIATAKIRISHPESNTPYIDYLMLAKVNGHWIIVHKMFTQEMKK